MQKYERQKIKDARLHMYDLIAQFRKNADQSEDQEVALLFEISANFMAQLTKTFHDYESKAKNNASNQ